MRMRVGLRGGGRPDRGRRVRRAARHRPGPASPASTSAAAGACARPDDGTHAGDAAALLRSRPAGISGMIADRVSAPMVKRNLERVARATCNARSKEEEMGARRPGIGHDHVGCWARPSTARRSLARGGRHPADAAGQAARALLHHARALGPHARPPGTIALAARYPDETMIVDELGTLTFGEVHERTNALAHALLRRRHQEGDGVGIMCRNHRGFIEATVAASKLGADALYLNTAFAGPQLTEVVQAREAGRDHLRRGVQRAARGRRQAPQALRRLARLRARPTTRRSRS